MLTGKAAVLVSSLNQPVSIWLAQECSAWYHSTIAVMPSCSETWGFHPNSANNFGEDPDFGQGTGYVQTTQTAEEIFVDPINEDFHIFETADSYNAGVDLSSDPADSLTWDRSMTTLAVLLRFRKNFMIKVEYYLNGEETGASEVDNDEFVVQFEAKF